MMPILSFLHWKWSLPSHKFGKKILLSKSPGEIWIMKRSAFRLLTEIQQDFIKEFFLATKKAIWSLSLKYLLLRQGFKRFKETERDWKRPSRGRPAHAGQSFQHQACNLVILYAIGEVEIVTRCANTAQICCKVIVDAWCLQEWQPCAGHPRFDLIQSGPLILWSAWWRG